MGKVYSLMTKPIRTFNIENRARRVISREKPIRAPEYPSAKKQRDVVDDIQPNFMEHHYKKDAQLDKRLKDVFVVSNDPNATLKTNEEETTTKTLPQMKSHYPEFEFGVFESNNIPQGKCTLRQAMMFIVGHNENPEEFSVQKISNKYKLDPQVVKNILYHFKIPQMSLLGTEALTEIPKKKENT